MSTASGAAAAPPDTGSAAAGDLLVGEAPLVVVMTLLWVDMTLRGEILEGQSWDP